MKRRRLISHPCRRLYRRWGRKYDYNTMSDPQTLRLDYAARPLPWHRRRAVRRWTVRVAFLAAGVFAVVRWGPSVWHHVQLLWSQRQCLAYSAPKDQLIYVSDPKSDTFTKAKAQPPNCWLAVEASLPPPASLPPDPHLVPAWEGFTGFKGAGTPRLPTSLPHQRRQRAAGGCAVRESGTARLAAIRESSHRRRSATLRSVLPGHPTCNWFPRSRGPLGREHHHRRRPGDESEYIRRSSR